MIVQLQQLEIREREREEATRLIREHQVMSTEWQRKEALLIQERDRLAASLAEESRLRVEDREREKQKTQRVVADIEVLEAQLDQLRVADRLRLTECKQLETRLRESEAARKVHEDRISDLLARLKGEGRAESDVVADLHARLAESEQMRMALEAQVCDKALSSVENLLYFSAKVCAQVALAKDQSADLQSQLDLLSKQQEQQVPSHVTPPDSVVTQEKISVVNPSPSSTSAIQYVSELGGPTSPNSFTVIPGSLSCPRPWKRKSLKSSR